MTRTLMVELGSRSYPIHIGSGILGRSDMLMPHVGGRQVMVVTNETIAPLYLDRLLDYCLENPEPLFPIERSKDGVCHILKQD